MSLRADLRYSIRSLSRTPGVALALLFTIALGIGSNAAVVGFVRGLVTRALPVPGLEAAVSLYARDAGDALGPVSYNAYLSLKAERETFELLGAFRESQGSTVIGGRTLVLSVAAVTPEFADLLDQSLREGIVISHRVWQDEFGGKQDVQGESIRIDGVDGHVADVAPAWLEGLYLGNAVDVWTPLAPEIGGDSRTYLTLGRLRPGLSPARAQAVVNATRSGPDVIAVLPYSGLTPEMAGGLLRVGTLLSAAAAAVFFIACANVATLLLSRASARSRETSVRVAIGASRGQLARQLLTDSALISLAGGAFGLLLAVWTANVVPSLFFDQDAEQLVFAPDVLSIFVVSATCVAITVACGLMPLFETRHDDPASVLRRESAGPSVAMRRLRAWLIGAQMACCCGLVISTGLLLTGFRAAMRTSAGHRLEQSIIATFKAREGFARPDLGFDYFSRAEQAALSVQDIASIAWVWRLPGARPVWQSFRVELPQTPSRNAVMDVVAFTPRLLPLIVVPPIDGRMFGGGDTTQTCRVAIINEEAAKDVFEGDAVGRSVEDPAGQRVEIIGVVGTRHPTHSTAATRPTIYYYAEQTGTVDDAGATRFRVPVQSDPVSAVLDVNLVSSSYFGVMGLAPVAGTIFPDHPPSRTCRVGVINQEAAELYFGGHAVGGAVIDSAGRRTEIGGVVHSTLLRRSQRRPEPAIFFPMMQDFFPRMTLVLDARQADEATVTSVRGRFDSVPGGATGSPSVLTLREHLNRTALATDRIAMVLVGASAAMALALGVIGLYGAMTDAARQRQPEIALRIALGAQGWRVVRQILSEGAVLAGAGAIAGMLGSVLVARWLSRIMPTAGSPTIGVWLTAPLVLAVAVAIASVLPARRALAVDPLAVMRDE
jgi:putative ABC transport system permease protein